jgi:hypothetical protein
MQPPSILWPLPWWTAVLAAALAMGVPWLMARARASRWNREVSALGSRLREQGMALEPDSFSVGEGKNVLVVDADRFAVADLKSWRIVQTFWLKEASALKIYEDRSNRIEFRLVLRGGAQTRKIGTQSIAGFGKLFALFGRAGKPVEYIQS